MNKYSTNVPPEGALRMMFDGFKNNKINFKNEVTAESTKTKLLDIEVMDVTEQLYTNSVIWALRISDFNENKAGKMSIRAMTNILKPLYISLDELIKKSKGCSKNPSSLTQDIFEAFWKGIEKWEPAMFANATSHEYGITKSSQCEVLTGVLNNIVKEFESWKKLGTNIGSLTDPKTYHSLINDAWNSSNLSDKDGNGNTVYGSDFWKVGKVGAMGKYTSAAAKRDLRNQLFKLIKDDLKRHNPSII